MKNYIVELIRYYKASGQFQNKRAIKRELAGNYFLTSKSTVAIKC